MDRHGCWTGPPLTAKDATMSPPASSNYDPMALSDEKRFELNEKIRQNPRGFVYVDIRPGSPGGDLPVHGAIKLRSMLQMLVFVANGLRDAPEFDVAPDARSGTLAENPRTTLGIDVSSTAPTGSIASVEFAGKHYSVANTRWDRATFAMLGDLFQTAVGEVKDVGVPITISKQEAVRGGTRAAPASRATHARKPGSADDAAASEHASFA